MAAPAEPRLRFHPASRLTPALVKGLRQHKAAILERLEAPEVSRRRDNGVIRTIHEVQDLAHAHLGEMAHPEEVPYAPSEPGRDPLVHLHTDKARFFRGVRGRDLSRREREGLPPWIQLVDGGGDAA